MRHKIILSAMLSGLFLLTGCMEDPDFFTPLSEQADSGNIASDVVYNGILESLQNRSEHSEYSGYVDAETAEMAVAEIRRSHPEFFWIDGYVVSSGISGSEISIVTLNGLTSEDLDEMTRELEAAADSLISEIPDSLDDYGKIIYVHDYIIYNTVYDNYGAASEENGLWGTAYGCLVEGNAVCQGYSEAFQYIMNRLDIPCGIATGMAWSGNPYSQSGETAEMLPHAWNYVQINGKYYWIDVTGRPRGAGSRFSDNAYLLSC